MIAEDLTKQLFFFRSTIESKVSFKKLVDKSWFAASDWSDENKNTPDLSLFMINHTQKLQKPQSPSKKRICLLEFIPQDEDEKLYKSSLWGPTCDSGNWTKKFWFFFWDRFGYRFLNLFCSWYDWRKLWITGIESKWNIDV